MQDAHALLHLVPRHEAGDPYLRGADHLDVDARVRQRAEHPARDAWRAQHAGAHDRELRDATGGSNAASADLLERRSHQLHCSLEVRLGDREGQIRVTRAADVLNDDVD